MTDQKAEPDLKTLYQITGNAADINTILINRGEFCNLRADLERASMQLVACGVVAMSDTPESAKKARIMHPDYESSSLDDVKLRVDECIELRARVAELEAQLESIGAGGVGPLMQPASSKHVEIDTMPDGWKLVPVVPTQKMVSEGSCAVTLPGPRYIDESAAKKCWEYMLSAAPQPPATEQPQGEQQPRYLDGGSRYKVTHLKTSGYCILGIPKELLGRWVALVDATDNKHMDDRQPPAVEQQQGEQEPVAWIENIGGGISYNPYHDAARKLPDGVRFDLYVHQQNLRCKSNQARLATLWGYEKKQPPRQPLTDEQKAAVTRELNRARCLEKRVVGNVELTDRIASAIERAHHIGGGA